MINAVLPIYQTLDPKKKTPEWANLQLTLLRRDQRRLVNANRSWIDRASMYSVEELKEVRDSFDDEDFKKTVKFLPIPILEPMLNSVVEDITRRPPKAELKALDPTATDLKKKDIELLRNRSIVENDRSELQSRVGLPPYKLGKDKFNGNVEQFDSMNLDSNDPEDVNFYEQNLQRLKFEIAGQSVIDAVFKNSRFDKQLTRSFVKDIFALKTICSEKFVDKVTGEIKDRYIDPQNCFGIFGQTNDGRDDICRGWQDSLSVMQFLEMVGDEFVFERDWRFLLWGINYCNIRKFTGFIRNGVPFDCCGNVNWTGEMGLDGVESSLMDWSMAYTYKIYIGRIQWRSPEATSNFLTNKNNKSFVEEIDYSYQLKKKQIKEGYEKESRYQIPWYESYYIATTSVSQWIFGFGKVYFQSTYGANDEYCNGSIMFYQEEGLSATEIARPYIQTANFTFYRMLWVIYKAKPDPDEYVFDELLQMAKMVQRQFPQSGTNGTQNPGLENILMDTIKQQRAKHVRLRTYPRIDGRPVQQIHPIEQKGRGGLDPIAISMQAVTQWAEAQIAQKIGLNSMRLGQNPPPRESTRTEENTVQYSMITTGYIYRMVQYLKEHSAISCLNYAQDIIKFKDTLPYKWLLKIVGAEQFEDLKSLDDFAAHRCGLFIEDYNDEQDKQDLKAAATLALQEGQIDITQYYLITQTQNTGKAILMLGRYKEKAAKQAQDAEMQKITAAQQLQDSKINGELKLIDRKGGWDLKVEQERTRSFVAAAQIAANSKINVKEIQVASEPPKIDAKAQADKELATHKANIDQGLPATVTQAPTQPPVPTNNVPVAQEAAV